jgi:hypothetical protein
MAFDGFLKIKGKILWTYTQQNRQGGSAMGNVAAGWDRRRNRPA